jgi:Txe/YoeB family toxin of Txe-Axe toxin-antitoxin module
MNSTKYAKFIPPKLEFKGDLTKMQVKNKISFGDAFISRLMMFKGYIILNVNNGIAFYEKETYIKIFQEDFTTDDILSIKKLDDDTLLIAAFDKTRIIRFEEKEPKKISYELIQEITDTDFYYIGELLSNGLLLLAGGDQKYVFYQLENFVSDRRISKNNLFKKIGEIEKVHNVYNDDFARVIDLNSGYLFSMMNDDKNIKIIQYEGDFKIIKNIDGYQLHDACLISDKYVVLKGLTHPKYYTWLFDVEKLEVVKKWETPENDGFALCISENKFFTGSTLSLAISVIEENNGNLELKDIYRVKYADVKDEYDFEKQFIDILLLNENSFIGCSYNSILAVIDCI